MNGFFEHKFDISRIVVCVKVLAGKGTPRHRNRPFHGLVFQLSGTARYTFAVGAADVSAGSLFYLPRGSDYDVERLDAGDCIAVNFETRESDTFPFFVMPAKFGEKYRHAFGRMLSLWQAEGAWAHNAILAELYNVISQVQSDAAQSYLPPRSVELAKKAKEALDRGLADTGLSVAKVAKSLGVTPEYLRRVFASHFGESPKKYVVDRRVRLAKTLIDSGEIKLSQVGALCGFASASWFSTEFRAATGMTPSEYRAAKK